MDAVTVIVAAINDGMIYIISMHDLGMAHTCGPAHMPHIRIVCTYCASLVQPDQEYRWGILVSFWHEITLVMHASLAGSVNVCSYVIHAQIIDIVML